MKHSLLSLMIVTVLVWLALGVVIANLRWVSEYEPLFLDSNVETIEDRRLPNEPKGEERDSLLSTEDTARWFEQFQRDTKPLPNSLAPAPAPIPSNKSPESP